MWGTHSTQRGAWTALGLVLTGTAAGQQAPDSTWLDVEGRIQYAYYTEDSRSLANVAESLATQEDAGGMQSYYRGLAYFRLALLAATREPGHKNGAPAPSRVSAESAAERCVTSLDDVLETQAEHVEALALQAACLNTLSQLKPLRAPLAQSRSRAHLAKAARLAPANPRVLLVEAESAPPDQKASLLHRAVVAFEAERQGLDKAPGWGAAEAYETLGRYRLARGEILPARDALERALLIAPEFTSARRLLARITAG